MRSLTRACELPSEYTYHSDDTCCVALVRLHDLGVSKVRRSANALDDKSYRNRHGIGGEPGNIKFSHQLTENRPIRGDSSRLFEQDNPNGIQRSSVALADLRFSGIQNDARTHTERDPSTSWQPMTVVKGLTVNGKGGEFTFEDGRISACLWFYLEMRFIAHPSAVTLERISAGNDMLGYPIYLGKGLLEAQEENLEAWFQVYRRAERLAPTRRPIAERYYQQLKRLGLGSNEERWLGNNLFGPKIFNQMEACRKQIFQALELEDVWTIESTSAERDG